jgi:hypothetical protein
MRTRMHSSLRAALGILLLFGMWQVAAAGAGWTAAPGHVSAAVLLLVAALAGLCCILFGRVRPEHGSVQLDAGLCREQAARRAGDGADAALAEADLLLARVRGRSTAGGQHDPVGQLGLVQAELMQMQNGAADPAVAARIDMLRTRLELVARAVRQARPLETG